MRVPGLAAMACLAGTALVAPASAGQINTGGETGAYHATFCPQVAKALARNKFDYTCSASEGSAENVQRTVGDPAQVGFAQLDVFALEADNLGGQALFTRIRSDIARECLFMVTRNRGASNFGQIASVASQLHFILPPRKSGSAGTFELLQRVDPQGLGLARNITYAASVDDAINQALGAEDAVTLFVQFPDPGNARFQAIAKQGGNIIPVLDRSVLRQEADGEKIYFAEETEIVPPKWNKSAEKIITACTPMLLFTGASERIADANGRKDQDDLVRTLRGLPVEDLRPRESTLAALWRKTKALSATSIEKLVALTDKARAEAKPTIDAAMKRAKEMAEEAQKQGKDLLDKAQKATGANN